MVPSPSLGAIFLFALSINGQLIARAGRASFPRGLPLDSESDPTPVFDLKARQATTTAAPTCGYLDGDRDKPRTADKGFDCRVDTLNALWGFCPTTVIAPRDCGLAGNCVDKHDCSKGCGIFGDPSITTFTCDFCSTALLTAGPDQTYSYLACGDSAETAHLLASFTTSSDSSTSTTSSSASPSSTRSSSTASSTSGPTSPTPKAPSPSPPSTPPTTGKSPSNGGAIAGGVVGGLTFVCVVVLGIFFVRRRKARQAALLPPPKSADPFDGAGSGPGELDAKDTQKPAELVSGQHMRPELPTEDARSPVEMD